MKIITLLIAMLLIVVGCKTTKTVTDIKTQSVEKRDISQVLQKKTTDSAAAIIVNKSVAKDSSSEIITEYIFSIPDSTGVQYVTKLRTIGKTVTSVINYDTKHVATRTTSIDTTAKLIDKTVVKEKVKDNSVTEVKDKSIWFWLVFIAAIIVTVFSLLGLLKITK